jgi:acetyltransferase-like isoleucine patch superfamily enzyme
LQDVPPFHVVAGNPARIIRKIKSALDPDKQGEQKQAES